MKKNFILYFIVAVISLNFIGCSDNLKNINKKIKKVFNKESDKSYQETNSEDWNYQNPTTSTYTPPVSMNYSVFYNNNFDPNINVHIKNNTDKSITSIVFTIVSQRKGADMFDTRSFNYDSQKREIFIPSYAETNLFLSPHIRSDYQLKNVIIDKIRYSDGTIREL